MFTETAHLYDTVYASKDYDGEASRLRELIGRHGRADARTLLDVACGTGQHLARLRAWYDVAGVELDPAMLAIARERLPSVPLSLGDMTDLSLGRRFDVVTCLFSSVGYTRTDAGLRRAVASMAAHVAPGGLLLVEAWYTPDAFVDGHLHGELIQGDGVKIARVGASAVRGTLSLMTMHYLVATRGTVTHLEERHELGLFTEAQYRAAFEAAGLSVAREPEGLTGRGIYVGRAPA